MKLCATDLLEHRAIFNASMLGEAVGSLADGRVSIGPNPAVVVSLGILATGSSGKASANTKEVYRREINIAFAMHPVTEIRHSTPDQATFAGICKSSNSGIT